MTNPARRIWVDGELVPWEQATVHLLGQSVQRGTLVFDVMPVYETAAGVRVLGLAEHVDRFRNSAEQSAMDLGYDRDALLRGIGETVRANPGCEVVKISGYWPGVSLDLLPADSAPSVAIAAFSAADLDPGHGAGSEKQRPMRLRIAEPTKLPPGHLSPHVKIAAGYTAAAAAKRRARDAGFDDILFLDEQGEVAESSTQSFFLVEGGTIRTAPLRYVLAGITRRSVLELIHSEGIPCKEDPIPRDLLHTADEAFLAGTTIQVCPVARIDDREFAAPGPVTAQLQRRYAELTAGEDSELSPRWMQALP